MDRKHIRWFLLCLVTYSQVSCCWHRGEEFFCDIPCEECLAPSCGPGQLEIDEPCPTPCCDGSAIPPAPVSIPANGDVATFDLTLEQAITIALEQSRVLRDLGGTVLRAPAAVASVYDPAIAYTDPRFGEEAALSAFDATFAARGSWQQNDRIFNNTFIGDGGVFEQDLNNYTFEVSKRATTGTQMAFRHVVDYDLDNSVGNRRNPSVLWGAYFDAEVRHPLMQGSGVLFNRIAGPTNQPGAMNGVLIARIRTDIDLADFEVGVRDLVSNVENAYWDLYFAYRDLDAKKRARDQALEMWAEVSKKEGKITTATDEAQAREQYWRFQAEVLDALSGRVTDATRTNNGSSAGTFRNSGGVRVAERRLRLILGLPINSVQIIKPISEPPVAPVQFDWQAAADDALAERSELRRQRWIVKQREMELLASRNFLLPRLDAVARYRMRGFGHHLISQSDANLSSAFGGLGDNNEWQLGVEFEVPLGYRRAHAGVRNAELALSRERAILRESGQHVLYGLSNAFGEVERAFVLVSAQYNRLDAATEQLKASKKGLRAETVTIDVVLESQRREAEADIRYHQSRIEYALALKSIHYEKGMLLEYNNVFLAESGSPRRARYASLKRREQQRPKFSYICRDVTISQGAVGNTVLSQAYSTIDVQEVVPEPVPVPTQVGQPLGDGRRRPSPLAPGSRRDSATWPEKPAGSADAKADTQTPLPVRTAASSMPWPRMAEKQGVEQEESVTPAAATFRLSKPGPTKSALPAATPSVVSDRPESIRGSSTMRLVPRQKGPTQIAR